MTKDGVDFRGLCPSFQFRQKIFVLSEICCVWSDCGRGEVGGDDVVGPDVHSDWSRKGKVAINVTLAIKQAGGAADVGCI